MSHTYLESYLNDHLSGAMMAVELLAHLEQTHAGTEVQQFAAALHADIEADRQDLLALMRELGVTESRVRQGVAWVAEKATRLKLRMDDPDQGSFLLFEILEGLSLGIEGKVALWMSLAAAAEVTPRLRVRDYDGLLRRARSQRERVDVRRLSLARTTLSNP
jgi:hypothetical protein